MNRKYPLRPSSARKPAAPNGPQGRSAPQGRDRNRPGPRPQARPSFSECAIKDICQSCRYVNEPYAASLDAKYQAGLKILADAGVLTGARTLAPVASPKPLGYRAAIKLAVRPAPPVKKPAYVAPTNRWQPGPAAGEGEQAARFTIGLFKPGSHDVVDLSYCPLHVPAIGKLIRAVKAELEASTLNPWDESSGQGDIRYLAIRASHVTGELMLTVVATSLECRGLVKEMARRLQDAGHHLHAVHVNVNNEPGNHIFGANTVRVVGQSNLRESLCDLSFEISPTSFFQINPWQAHNLYRRIEQLVSVSSSQPVAWDLFCGAGQIAMILARAGFRVIGIEENPQAITDGQANVRRNQLESHVDFIVGRVEDVSDTMPAWAKDPQVIVANPSRRGIAEKTRADLVRHLSRTSQCQFLYVSCDVNSLARDLADLVKSGYKVRQIEAFDMFAQTDKLEWLAVLTP